jgi:phospholipase A1
VPRDYQHGETRIQLSVRTKIAQGLLTQGDPMRKDSVWFGYTQQSYWQVFNSDLSRPFRNTDHEPEVVYIYPSDVKLPGGWRMRYSGAALTHQSNGQSLPLSRSWNRASLMAGFEKDDRFMLTAKLWKRMQEDAIKDDNPHIENYIGRAELAGAWNIDQKNTVAATLRHNLRSNGNGSLRLEWLSTLGTSSNSTIGSGLRFHTQLFTGYGDSLIDFNRRRTVLNVGLSLVDF